MLRLIQVNRVVRPADYKTPVSMRKRIGGGKTDLLAIGSPKKFFSDHEISRQGLTLLKESVLFQDCSVFGR
jgi:hypothetical protein